MNPRKSPSIVPTIAQHSIVIIEGNMDENSAKSVPGAVIEHSGKKYVLSTEFAVAETYTNALKIYFCNDNTKDYPARIKFASSACDLAILEIDDKEFQQIARPCVLGGMVTSKQSVSGMNISLKESWVWAENGAYAAVVPDGYSLTWSKGIVACLSTEEVKSNFFLLKAGIDAEVMGPVFSNDELVGIVTSGFGFGFGGLNFMTPIPTIRHFLIEVFSGSDYRGFPALPFTLQKIRGALTITEFLAPNSDVCKKLQIGDVLLKIDNLDILDHALVNFPGIDSPVDMGHVPQTKFVGDNITFQIRRKKQTIDISATLDYVYEPNDVSDDEDSYLQVEEFNSQSVSTAEIFRAISATPQVEISSDELDTSEPNTNVDEFSASSFDGATYHFNDESEEKSTTKRNRR